MFYLCFLKSSSSNCKFDTEKCWRLWQERLFVMKFYPRKLLCKSGTFPLQKRATFHAKPWVLRESLGVVGYGVYNCSTVHNDHDKENISLKKNKKTLEIEMWKICRLQSLNGEKQADKRPIPKQKPCTDCQKSSFFLVVWPRNGSLSPPQMLGTPK